MRRSAARALVSVALVASLVAACSGSGSSATPVTTPAPTPGSTPAATVSVSAAPAAGSPALGSVAPGSVAPAPSLGLFQPGRTLDPAAPKWPSDVIDAAIALAVLDNGIKQAVTDMSTAAGQEDMRLFLGAATGLAAIVEKSMPSAQRLSTFPETQQVGASYLPVLTSLDTAATAMATALRGGDGPGVQTASAQLGAALGAYAGVRDGMVEIADRALLMKRALVQ